MLINPLHGFKTHHHHREHPPALTINAMTLTLHETQPNGSISGKHTISALRI